MDKKTAKAVGRRDFFKRAGLGAGVAGAAAAGLATGTASAAKPAEKASGNAGYRETEHVKKYYELTRF